MAFAARAVIHLGDTLAVDAFTSARHDTLVFGVVTAMGTLSVDRVLWFPALAYVGAFMASSILRESFHDAVFVSNVVLLVSLIRLLRAPAGEAAAEDAVVPRPRAPRGVANLTNLVGPGVAVGPKELGSPHLRWATRDHR